MKNSTKKNLFVSKDADKFIDKLNNQDLEDRLRAKVESLRVDPLPSGVKHIGAHTYRVRVGDYRIIYLFHKGDILISKIGHRREVYR